MNAIEQTLQMLQSLPLIAQDMKPADVALEEKACDIAYLHSKASNRLARMIKYQDAHGYTDRQIEITRKALMFIKRMACRNAIEILTKYQPKDEN
jgi:hypothetical protein